MKYLKHINELNSYNQEEDLKEVIKDFLDSEFDQVTRLIPAWVIPFRGDIRFFTDDEKIKWDNCNAIGVGDDEIDTNTSWNNRFLNNLNDYQVKRLNSLLEEFGMQMKRISNTHNISSFIISKKDFTRILEELSYTTPTEILI